MTRLRGTVGAASSFALGHGVDISTRPGAGALLPMGTTQCRSGRSISAVAGGGTTLFASPGSRVVYRFLVSFVK